MELCKKREKCIAKSICAMNIKLDGYNCKQFHLALEEKLNSTELMIERVHKMAVESLPPDEYEKLLHSLMWLCKTRKISNSLPQAGKQQGQPAIPLSIVREVLEDKYDPMAVLDIDELIDDMEETAKQQA